LASASPTTAPRQWPTCIGPVGLAETYSTLTFGRAERRAAVVGAGFDHRRQHALPISDGELDVDEARTGNRNVGDVSIFLQLGDDDLRQRARIGAERLCQHHRSIGRDIAMAWIARRLNGDTAEIKLGSLFLDHIKRLFRGRF
jgi:hypothetical protein